MARSYTLGTLVTRVKQLADMENDDSIGTTEWKTYVSQVYGELGVEVFVVGHRQSETSTTVTATGAASYNAPTGLFGTVRIARVIDASGHEVDLEQLRPGEEENYRGTTGDATRYTVVADQLYLYPKPSSGSYKWYYTAQPTDLSATADGTSVDTYCPAGEAFLIWGVVAMALSKHKKDTTFALSQQAAARARIPFEIAHFNLIGTRTRGPVELDDDVTYDAQGWPIR